MKATAQMKLDSKHDQPHRALFTALVSAEFHRARQTRSLMWVLGVAVGLTLLTHFIRILYGSSTSFGAETATMGTDILGFALLLGVATMVARDYQNGSVNLLRVLTPVSWRRVTARIVGTSLLGILGVGAVMLVGLMLLLIFNPLDPATVNFALADAVLRIVTTTCLLACLGVGIGLVTRSSATATFLVIALYWLLPIVTTVANLSGLAWTGPVTEATLGILASKAILHGPEHWLAAIGLACWAAMLISLGMYRETKGTLE